MCRCLRHDRGGRSRGSGVNGRLVGGILIGAALIAGAAIYWLQVYAFYRDVPEAEAALTLTDRNGQVEPLAVSDFRAIDASSSPIRFRACFRTRLTAQEVERFAPYPGAEPLIAPRWFDCFDAPAIGAALASGAAKAFLGAAHSEGYDRVIALYPDGRAYAWQQINPTFARETDARPAP
ncbi:histidine kinase [Haematobacter genomosp. 1]|uniref:Histidine kinase n=1 Tax=Haematobacter genomosp. 1 TaxID=366618 RepID=A0A212AF18_9RHOB|nr:histidine kinase [Haematobacter genomosp. 1]